MEFQVFIHRINVVEYILDDPWNDAHAIWIVQVTLHSQTFLAINIIILLKVWVVYGTLKLLIYALISRNLRILYPKKNMKPAAKMIFMNISLCLFLD